MTEPPAPSPRDRPAPEHVPPPGLDDATVTALGQLSEALETTERARGHLYAFHQLTGYADLLLDDVIARLHDTGHDQLATRIQTDLLGRNVLPGRWTFQIVEEYDDGYYRCFRDIENRAREQLAGGRRHLQEARLKERRRTRDHPAHRATP